MNIVVLDGYTLNPGDLNWDALKELGEVTLYDRTPEDLILSRLENADIAITNKTPLSRETLSQLKGLKYIGVLATGYNVVDVTAAKDYGIAVTNVPTYGTDAVAQFVFALILNHCHHVESHSQSVYQGQWTKSIDFCYWNSPLMELSGKTLGLVGYGRIARRTAEIALAFGMQVLVWYHRGKPETAPDNLTFVDLETLLSRADFISLHVPLTQATEGMINADRIALMKPNAFVINTARGPIIDEEALAHALNTNKIAGAAVDVVSKEPIVAENPLLKAKNCTITPHIAWAPIEARQRLMQVATDNLKAFIAGHRLNRVDH